MMSLLDIIAVAFYIVAITVAAAVDGEQRMWGLLPLCLAVMVNEAAAKCVSAAQVFFTVAIDSPAISPPPYCTEFEYGDFLAPGPRRQYVVVLRNGPLRSRCYYLTGLYLLFICPTCLVIALELQ